MGLNFFQTPKCFKSNELTHLTFPIQKEYTVTGFPFIWTFWGIFHEVVSTSLASKVVARNSGGSKGWVKWGNGEANP